MCRPVGPHQAGPVDREADGKALDRDVMHERDRLSPRMQAWVELYGILLLLLPFCGLVLVFAPPFVAESWASGEVSPLP